jgi:alpha-ketoglutaric semialdehyde dehydrogenase
MPLTGELLIGHSARRGTNGEIFGLDAATGEKLQPGFGGATLDDLEQAASLAAAAFRPYRETSLEARAKFLEAIAQNILDIGDELIERCVKESGLPRGRIEGERGRTVGQLRLFANVVRDGGFIGARIDPAMPDRTPLPRPDLRLRQIGVGPVAVFGASNFPLAFSVAGGDTASALAAGCPVIVKAHSAHPGTSELVGRAVQRAVKECEMPEGTFSLLFDSGRSIGQGLVADHRIKAAGFTGSRAGGTALMKIAASRPEPIPVYAEMSSINPVLLFPGALAARGEAIGKAFVGALTMGAGQFCTNQRLRRRRQGGPGLGSRRDHADPRHPQGLLRRRFPPEVALAGQDARRRHRRRAVPGAGSPVQHDLGRLPEASRTPGRGLRFVLADRALQGQRRPGQGARQAGRPVDHRPSSGRFGP